MIVACGRVCIDEFYMAKGRSNRVGATKLSAEFLGRQLGGSIFHSLKVISDWGIDCNLLCDYPSELARSERVGDNLNIFGCNKSCPAKSLIIGSEGVIKSIISIDEKEDSLLSETDALSFLDKLPPMTESDFVMIDLRQREANSAIARIANAKKAFVILDPGSTVYFSMPQYADIYKSIIANSDMIIAAPEFFSEFGDFPNLTDYFECDAFSDCKILVCTLNNGYSVIATKDFSFSIGRGQAIDIGNTMCAGDAFRGAFVASLYRQRGDFMRYECLLDAAKNAIAAATIKISEKDFVPTLPRYADILQMKKQLNYIIVESNNIHFVEGIQNE